jgi:hypothetical protein
MKIVSVFRPILVSADDNFDFTSSPNNRRNFGVSLFTHNYSIVFMNTVPFYGVNNGEISWVGLETKLVSVKLINFPEFFPQEEHILSFINFF